MPTTAREIPIRNRAGFCQAFDRTARCSGVNALMSTRFFAAVRRNQKQWMVVVTVLSMVSFLFLDDLGRGSGPMSPMGGGLLIGCLCAAGLCVIGYPRGLATEYGCGGFIAGFLAGFLGFGAVGTNKPVAMTAFGNYSRKDLYRLAEERRKSNAFVFAVSRRTQKPVNGFGSMDDQSILLQQGLLNDAKKMGVQVSDARVNEFLRDIHVIK